MVINIICPVIMSIKSSKKKYRWVLSMEVKRKFWLKLPYRLRLRIEHFSYVANILIRHWPQIDVKFFRNIKHFVYLKAARLYSVILKLNNPYSASTNLPVSDEDAAERINKFLLRVSSGQLHSFDRLGHIIIP